MSHKYTYVPSPLEPPPQPSWVLTGHQVELSVPIQQLPAGSLFYT